MNRTYRVTFPDGTFAERSTKTMTYRFAICAQSSQSGEWHCSGFSQSRTAAESMRQDRQRRVQMAFVILPVELVKGAEVEWRRNEERGVIECLVTATTNPKKWPVGAILNTLALTVAS